MPYRPIFDDLGCRYLGADLDARADIAVAPDGVLGVADASADLLLSFQVLEHVRDVALYLSEARRALCADGWMLLSTHGAWLYHPHPEDHRRWTREGLIGEIEKQGFEVTECVPVVGPLGWTTVLRLTCWVYALNRIPLLGRPAAWLMSIVMNTRALIEEAITPAEIKNENACVYLTLSRPRGATHA
jgi:SAM-dependent methyltransferase